MKKENRLKKRKQFNWTFKNGTAIHSKALVLVFTSSRGTKKIGFSVSKKVGKAVIRNKVKRRLREILTKYILKIADNHTLIFVAKQEINSISFFEIENQVINLLKKAKLFKEL